MSNASEIIESMKSKFNPSAAEGMDTVFQFNIENAGFYSLVVKDGSCSIAEGENADADVTLIMDLDTFKAIANGEQDGMQAFMAGKLRTEGNMMLALKLSELFPV